MAYLSLRCLLFDQIRRRGSSETLAFRGLFGTGSRFSCWLDCFFSAGGAGRQENEGKDGVFRRDRPTGWADLCFLEKD